ncbi:hypothetical protein [Streptomyces scabiei]|uniref:hypothetical protein n=1 Tax=Streptomyces scabiei TaxID=1930 RepID=UPI000B19F262|nr:hypothetical protein [Streptomyces scabiei]MDX3681388.1 hypothetical protein [Streptomyces scabiei]
MANRTDHSSPQPSPAERIAALQQQAADDYARYQAQRADARDQLAFARIHGNEQAGNR